MSERNVAFNVFGAFILLCTCGIFYQMGKSDADRWHATRERCPSGMACVRVPVGAQGYIVWVDHYQGEKPAEAICIPAVWGMTYPCPPQQPAAPRAKPASDQHRPMETACIIDGIIRFDVGCAHPVPVMPAPPKREKVKPMEFDCGRADGTSYPAPKGGCPAITTPPSPALPDALKDPQ